MASEAVALSFCPHLAGQTCPIETIATEVHESAPAEVVETPHCHSDKSVAGGDVPTAAETNSHAAADATEVNADMDALTPPDEDCSRCMMHSQNSPSASSHMAVQPGNTHESAAGCAAQTFELSLAANSILDLHDHGPPGHSGARYLLINVFRI